jgi:glycosyltransferase involved in cell wall biosynthesis
MISRLPHKQADDRISIAFFENGMSFGGAITCLAALIRSLNREKFRAIVLSSHDDAETRQAIEDAGGEFLFIRQYRRAKRAGALSQSVGRRQALIRYPLLALLLCYETLWRVWYGWLAWRVLVRYQVSLVHLNNSLGSNLEGVLAAWLHGVKCVLSLRCFEFNSIESRIAARWVYQFIAVSQAVADSLVLLGVPREKIQVIYDGIDLQECQARAAKPLDPGAFEFDRLNVGVVGILMPWKGQRVFVEAANILVNEMKARDCKFFLIGGPVPGGEDYQQELKKLATEAGLGEHLVFAGHQDNVFKFLNRMDVVVHTSILPEPFGRVIIEAMAMAKPVIATSMGGPLEIIEHGRDGLLIQENDPRSLAEAIYSLISKPDERAQIAQQARRKVETRFSLEHFAREMESFYAKLETG